MRCARKKKKTPDTERHLADLENDIKHVIHIHNDDNNNNNNNNNSNTPHLTSASRSDSCSFVCSGSSLPIDSSIFLYVALSWTIKLPCKCGEGERRNAKAMPISDVTLLKYYLHVLSEAIGSGSTAFVSSFTALVSGRTVFGSSCTALVSSCAVLVCPTFIANMQSLTRATIGAASKFYQFTEFSCVFVSGSRVCGSTGAVSLGHLRSSTPHPTHRHWRTFKLRPVDNPTGYSIYLVHYNDRHSEIHIGFQTHCVAPKLRGPTSDICLG